MIEPVSELPPIVITDPFGIHPRTNHAWVNFTQESWTDYLAAYQDAK
jgi:hypothetical protein